MDKKTSLFLERRSIRKYKPEKVKKEDLDAVLEYTGAAYPIVEFRNEMQNAVELQYIPATIFLNKDGDIVGKPVVGALDAEGWLAEIEGRLKELE